LNAILTSKWTKAVVFVACLVPLAVLVWRGFHNDLTLNPVEFVEHTTGDWTLRFLVITLAISPLRKILRLPQLIRFRRMFGLFAFFYVCLHFTAYLTIDQYFAWAAMLKDIQKRPFITVGFTGFVLLIPLAITSTAGWIRRLGGKRWQLLHRAIYVTAIAGVIHYYWLVKSDVRKPLEYAWIVGILLAWRVGEWLYRRSRRPVPRSVRSKTSASTETA
jgi:methionine sulfoxide reductase heme-binding subunit